MEGVNVVTESGDKGVKADSELQATNIPDIAIVTEHQENMSAELSQNSTELTGEREGGGEGEKEDGEFGDFVSSGPAESQGTTDTVEVCMSLRSTHHPQCPSLVCMYVHVHNYVVYGGREVGGCL